MEDLVLEVKQLKEVTRDLKGLFAKQQSQIEQQFKMVESIGVANLRTEHHYRELKEDTKDLKDVTIKLTEELHVSNLSMKGELERLISALIGNEYNQNNGYIDRLKLVESKVELLEKLKIKTIVINTIFSALIGAILTALILKLI